MSANARRSLHPDSCDARPGRSRRASFSTLPLTNALLAEMIGSARETVSAALGELAAAGFVHRNGRVYRLAVRPEDL